MGFEDPFFHKLAPVLIDQLGSFFPELEKRKDLICKTLQSEETSFNKTLDRGIDLFKREIKDLEEGAQISGSFAFKLYDTYGFPFDLTNLMARENGLTIDTARFEEEMETQKKRAREAHKSVDILVSDSANSDQSTEFVGYEIPIYPSLKPTFRNVLLWIRKLIWYLRKLHFTPKWEVNGETEAQYSSMIRA